MPKDYLPNQEELWNQLLPRSSGANIGESEKFDEIMDALRKGNLDLNFDFDLKAKDYMVTPLVKAVANGGSKKLIQKLIENYNQHPHLKFFQVTHRFRNPEANEQFKAGIAARNANSWAKVLIGPFYHALERYNKNKDPESLEILDLIANKLQLKKSENGEYDPIQLKIFDDISKDARQYFKTEEQIEADRLRETERAKEREAKDKEEQEIVKRMTAQELAQASMEGRLAKDHESSMLTLIERRLTELALNKMIEHYDNTVSEKGGVDKIIEEIQSYLLDKIGDPEALTNPDKRAGVDREADRFKMALRCLLDDPKKLGSTWPGTFHIPQVGSNLPTFTLPSGEIISFRKLLAYYWVAASDKNMPVREAEVAKANLTKDMLIEEERVNLIRQLAEIRRAHNGPGERFPDTSSIDNPSCPDGVFGRLSFAPLRNTISRKEPSVLGNATSEITEFILGHFPKKTSPEWDDVCETFHFIKNQSMTIDDLEFLDDPDKELFNLRFESFKHWIATLDALRNDFIKFIETRYGEIPVETKNKLNTLYERTVKDLNIISPVMIPNNSSSTGFSVRPPICKKLEITVLNYTKEQQIEKSEKEIVRKLEADFNKEYSSIINELNQLSTDLKKLEQQKNEMTPENLIHKTQEINTKYKDIEKKKQQAINDLLVSARKEKTVSLEVFFNMEEHGKEMLDRLDKFDVVSRSPLIQNLRSEYDKSLQQFERNESLALNALASQRLATLDAIVETFSLNSNEVQELEKIRNKVSTALEWLNSPEAYKITPAKIQEKLISFKEMNTQAEALFKSISSTLETSCEQALSFLSLEEANNLKKRISSFCKMEILEANLASLQKNASKRFDNILTIQKKVDEFEEYIGEPKENISNEFEVAIKQMNSVTEKLNLDYNNDTCFNSKDEDYFSEASEYVDIDIRFKELEDTKNNAINEAKRKKEWSPEEIEYYEKTLTEKFHINYPKASFDAFRASFATMRTTMDNIRKKREDVKNKIINLPKELIDPIKNISSLCRDTLTRHEGRYTMEMQTIKEIVQAQKQYKGYQQAILKKCRESDPPLKNLNEQTIHDILQQTYSIDDNFTQILNSFPYANLLSEQVQNFIAKQRDNANNLNTSISQNLEINPEMMSITNFYISDPKIIADREKVLEKWGENFVQYAREADAIDDHEASFNLFVDKIKEAMGYAPEENLDPTIKTLCKQKFEYEYPYSKLHESQHAYNLSTHRKEGKAARTNLEISKEFTKIVDVYKNEFLDKCEKYLSSTSGKDLATLEAGHKEIKQLLDGFKLKVYTDCKNHELISKLPDALNNISKFQLNALEKILETNSDYKKINDLIKEKKQGMELAMAAEKQGKAMDENVSEFIALLKKNEKILLSEIESTGKVLTSGGAVERDFDAILKKMNKRALELKDPEKILFDFQQQFLKKFNQMPSSDLLDKFKRSLQENISQNGIDVLKSKISDLKIEHKNYLADLEKELWKDYALELTQEMAKFDKTMSEEITNLASKKSPIAKEQRDILIEANNSFKELKERKLDDPDKIRRAASDLESFAGKLRSDIDKSEAKNQGKGFFSKIKQACKDLIHCVWGNTRTKILKLQENTKETTRTFFHFDAKKEKERLSQTRTYTRPAQENIKPPKS